MEDIKAIALLNVNDNKTIDSNDIIRVIIDCGWNITHVKQNTINTKHVHSGVLIEFIANSIAYEITVSQKRPIMCFDNNDTLILINTKEHQTILFLSCNDTNDIEVLERIVQNFGGRIDTDFINGGNIIEIEQLKPAITFY